MHKTCVITALHKEPHFVLFVCMWTVFVCSTEAQTHLVKATSAVERAVFITMHWVSSIKLNSDSVSQRAEELKTDVKKIGGYLQLLIQVLITVHSQLIQKL